MAYTIPESDYFSPSPEYDAYLDLLLARIRKRYRTDRKKSG